MVGADVGFCGVHSPNSTAWDVFVGVLVAVFVFVVGLAAVYFPCS